MRHLIPRAAILLAAIFAPAVATAEWVAPATTPGIQQIVAIDATGELNWPFGSEDVAGDGATFQQPEQSLDIRTAYAATDANRLWLRVYVSDPNAVGGDVVVYTFIDADENDATGGNASAPEVDDTLAADPTQGGYEYVIGYRGNETVVGLWRFDAPSGQYEPVTLMAADAVAEADQGIDPVVLFSSAHGYVQVNVELSLVGLTASCDARLYFRSTSTSGAASDADIGEVVACVPADTNSDGVPDVLEPPNGCLTDDECPFNGVCINGDCVFASPCTADADCEADESCEDDLCVVVPGGACTDSSTCGELVCTNQVCSPCTVGSADCGPGRTCGPDGRCVNATAPTTASGGTSAGVGGGANLNPGDVVQGGACTCEVASGEGEGAAVLALVVVGLAAAPVRRRKRPLPPIAAGGRKRSDPR